MKTEENQFVGLSESKRIRMTMVLMPDAYGNSGLNLAIIYINGVKNREFLYQNNDYFRNDSNIKIGSNFSDVDVYAIRIYDSALTSDGVQKNFINLLTNNDEKNHIQDKNDVLDINGSEIDFIKCRTKYNCFVFNKTFPSLVNNNRMKDGTLDVYFVDNPEWNVSISNVEGRGQGTSSMRYWKWNVRFGFDKANSIITYADGTTEIGYWAITPNVPRAVRLTAKKNFASSMQSHKIGSVNSIDDLYKQLNIKNEAMMIYPKVRMAVTKLPFLTFEKAINEEGEEK